MYTLWLEFTYFPKMLRSFKKTWIQKSDIEEVQNLKYRHNLGVVAHMI
jgi:hypothetical protein